MTFVYLSAVPHLKHFLHSFAHWAHRWIVCLFDDNFAPYNAHVELLYALAYDWQIDG